MALETFNGILSLRVRDENAEHKTIPLHCLVKIDAMTDMKTLLPIIVGVIDDMLDGRIVEANLTLPFDLGNNVKPAPLAGSNVHVGGLFSFRDSAGNANGVFFPTANNGIYVDGKVDASKPLVSPVLTIMTSDGTSGTAFLRVTDEDDRQLDSVASGGFLGGFRTQRK